MKQKIGVSVSVCLLLWGMFSCNKGQKTGDAVEEERSEKVRTMVLQPREIGREITLATVLQGYETMKVAPSLSGIIEEIYVEEGSRVKKGDLLVRLDQTQYQNTKLQYANLGVEMERMEALRKAGNVSQQVYDQTKVQYDQLRETLKLHEENTFNRAKLSGVVAAKFYEDGELYSMAQPILTIVRIDELKALINIPEIYFPKVTANMPVEIVSEIYPNQVFQGKIERVFPVVDESTHTFQAKLRIPNAKELLRPGMYVHTVLPLGKDETMVAPYAAVQKLIGSNERYVFLNKNGYAKRVAVELGQRFNTDVELLSDSLHPGDELVYVGQARLIDGVKLDVIKD